MLLLKEETLNGNYSQNMKYKIVKINQKYLNIYLTKIMRSWLNLAQINYILPISSNYLYMLMKKITIRTDPGRRTDFQCHQVINWLLETERDEFSKENTIFNNLSREHLEKLAQFCILQRFESNELIAFQGDKARCCYIIMSGSVDIYSNSLNVKKTVSNYDFKYKNPNSINASHLIKNMKFINKRVPGNVIGELALVIKSTRRSFSMISSQTTELLLVQYDLFLDFLQYYIPNIITFNERYDYLRNISYFKNWSEHEILSFAYLTEIRIFKREEFIPNKISHGIGLIFIKEGRVKALSLNNSYIIPIQLFIIPESSIISENVFINKPNLYNLQCLTDIQTIILPKRNFGISQKISSIYDLAKHIRNLYESRKELYEKSEKSFLSNVIPFLKIPKELQKEEKIRRERLGQTSYLSVYKNNVLIKRPPFKEVSPIRTNRNIKENTSKYWRNATEPLIHHPLASDQITKFENSCNGNEKSYNLDPLSISNENKEKIYKVMKYRESRSKTYDVCSIRKHRLFI